MTACGKHFHAFPDHSLRAASSALHSALHRAAAKPLAGRAPHVLCQLSADRPTYTLTLHRSATPHSAEQNFPLTRTPNTQCLYRPLKGRPTYTTAHHRNAAQLRVAVARPPYLRD